MKKIVFSTNNQNKLQEVKEILKDNYEVFGLKDIGFTGDIPETGTTLAENASIKSKFVYDKYGMDCFSDDTGLEIDALEGKPGVYSARYAGEDGNAERNIEKVMTELTDCKNREAWFKTVVSLLLNGKEYLFEGKVEGKIIKEKRGADGFGYDPIFTPDGYENTFAEMPSELKNGISHRGRAVRKLVAFLNKHSQ